MDIIFDIIICANRNNFFPQSPLNCLFTLDWRDGEKGVAAWHLRECLLTPSEQVSFSSRAIKRNYSRRKCGRLVMTSRADVSMNPASEEKIFSFPESFSLTSPAHKATRFIVGINWALLALRHDKFTIMLSYDVTRRSIKKIEV